MMGDKISSKQIAIQSKVPIIQAWTMPSKEYEEAAKIARKWAIPLC